MSVCWAGGRGAQRLSECAVSISGCRLCPQAGGLGLGGLRLRRVGPMSLCAQAPLRPPWGPSHAGAGDASLAVFGPNGELRGGITTAHICCGKWSTGPRGCPGQQAPRIWWCAAPPFVLLSDLSTKSKVSPRATARITEEGTWHKRGPHMQHASPRAFCFFVGNYPSPLCISYALVQATVGVSIRYQMQCSHISHVFGDKIASYIESWTHLL